MARKKSGDVGNLYRRCVDFILESKKFIYFTFGLFIFSTLLGVLVPVPSGIEEKILNYIFELLEMTEGLSSFEMMRFIFLNNIQSSFFGIFLGSLFGIFPLVSSLTNGYILGFVISKSMEIEGPLTILRLVPHGIFELPALFISLGLGLRLGLWLIVEPVRFYWKRYKIISVLFIISYLVTLLFALYFDKKFRKKMGLFFNEFKKNLWISLIVFFLIVLPLLVAAAIIEGMFISLS